MTTDPRPVPRPDPHADTDSGSRSGSGSGSGDAPPAPLTRDAFRRLRPIIEPRPLSPLPGRVWTEAEWERIRRGRHAWSMDERWNAFAEGNTLFLHRSWTGRGIYEATFGPAPEGGLRIVAAVVEGDRQHYKPLSDAYDLLMLEFVLSAIILGEPATELRARLRASARPQP
ncbi:hypothetical protein QIS99_15600 [Streptomyces sp. B-S-A8]|uniref:Uncharacterized protein n=1 Tax=Streptomyces solicavernae TaxID=3043614 RepID=A0ABT6RTG9_9ACTN|nr:hypothetical protein [Streptomyces sp. B-S-A8]MDI3387615.1 hypothetical protein [Streptomyces sp. B-S-A8]